MAITKIRTNNSVTLLGRITRVNEYGNGCANVTLAIANGEKESTFVQAKSFAPKVYGALKSGMLVQAIGHVATSSYEKDGNKVYTQDVVLDSIQFLESKATVAAREAAKA